jgi:uncharacterized protein YbaR (Trm112 family)
MIDEALRAILVCPACRASVAERDGLLQCVACGRRYPVRNGVPVMLLEEAESPPADQETRPTE